MAERDTLSRMGITKKDRKEMYGCLSYMLFSPIYIIVEGITAIVSLANKNSKKVAKRKKSKIIVQNSIDDFENFSINKIDNKIFLETKCFKLECWEYHEPYYIVFNYTLKWNNGSNFGGNLRYESFNLSIPFNSQNYKAYFKKAFELAKEEYKKNYKRDYNFYENVVCLK